MKIDQLLYKGTSIALVTEGEQGFLNSPDTTLDLLADVRYQTDCDKMVVEKSILPEAWFDLSTRLAGEMLQKFVNYSMKVAIVGDFTSYDSKALRDFIRESNRGKDIFFAATREEALERLAGV